MDFLPLRAPLRVISLCLCWALATTLLISRASGNICNVPWSADLKDYTAEVANQADLDTAFSGCKTINGNIWINDTYTGGFNLSEVVSMNGSIQVYNYGAGLTFMEFDNLITFSGLFYIQNSLHLKNISMASAVFMSYMQLESIYGGTNLDFPQLVNVTTFEIYGQFGSMNFPKLAYIESGMLVGSAAYSYVDPETDPSSWEQYPPMEINFPSLTYSACVLIWGNISSINMPLLETVDGIQLVEEYSQDGPEGLYIATYGTPLDVNFPRLSNTSAVALLGTIGNFSFPSLLNVDEISIYSYYNLNVNLFPVQRVTNISLTGNITAFNGSSLKEIAQSLYIQTYVPTLDCTTAQQIWSQTSHNSSFYTGIGFPAGINSDDSYGVYCAVSFAPYIYEYPKKPLSPFAIAGITVGGTILMTFLCICLVYRKNKKRKRNKPPYAYPAYPAYGVELQDRRGDVADEEVLPQYEPAVEAEELASPVSATSAGTARLPGYEDALHEGQSVSGGGAEEEDMGLLGRW